MMKHKPDAMLMATFCADCFCSATYPYIYRQIMSGITENAVAYNQIVNCISVIVFSWLWNRFSDKLFPYYLVFCVLEMIFGVCTSVWISLHGENLLCYYILDTLVFCLITRNIICGGVRLRAVRYPTESEREHFDNSNNAVSALATVIGSLIAVRLSLDFVHMVWVATVGNIIDNLFYICIFLHNQKHG